MPKGRFCVLAKLHTIINSKMHTTVVPLYTAPLTTGHPFYAARGNRQGWFSLYIYPSPTATSLTRPAASVLGSQSQHLPLTNGHSPLSRVQIMPPCPRPSPPPPTHTNSALIYHSVIFAAPLPPPFPYIDRKLSFDYPLTLCDFRGPFAALYPYIDRKLIFDISAHYV